jgi:hypothetical protein
MIKQESRLEIAALVVFIGVVAAMTLSGLSPAAAGQGSTCSLSFNGKLSTLQLSPAGSWTLTSTVCTVTDQSGGAVSGTFSGTLTSGTGSVVTGTWTASGSSYRVTAMCVDSTLSFSVDRTVDGTPVVGASYQGMLSGAAGQMLVASGIAGQVSLS